MNSVQSPLSPIFIGGQRRSGTTLMWARLNRHPNIVSLPECHFFQHVDFRSFFKTLRSDYRDVFARLGVRKSEMDQAVASFVDTLFIPRRVEAGAQRWLEKSPENIRRIDYLFRLFPDAQFVHMIRDPRDTLASMKEQAASYKPYWKKFTAEVTGPEWVQCIESGEQWRNRPSSYIEIQYERFVEEPEAVLRQVLSFLGEDWVPAVLDASSGAGQEKEGNEHKPVFRTSVGRWVEGLTPEEVTCVQSVAGEMMAEFGYLESQPERRTPSL
jgi:Sulfotransferase family